MNPKNFNVNTNAEVTNLVKDAISWDQEEKTLKTSLDKDLEGFNLFVQLVVWMVPVYELHRRVLLLGHRRGP